MDDLATFLADGDVFSVGSDRDGFIVSYDDVLAHEYADLVGESIAAIAAIPGVSDVIHEDRELLLVRANGVRARQVSDALDAFWRAAAARPLAWKETLKALAAAAAPTLKAGGFRKQGLRWNRETAPGFVQVIELSRAEAGAGFVASIDVGLFDEELARLRHGWTRPKFVDEMHCQVRRPMGTFPLADDPANLLMLLRDAVLPFLDAHASRRSVLAAEAAGTGLLNPIDRAIGLALEGDGATAHALLQERFDATRARAHILEVAARLSLPPIETGSDPNSSRAEEAFLPRWIDDQERAVARFRAAMAEAGIDAAGLDGSIGSLEHLRPDRWWPIVTRLQEGAPDTAESPLMQLPRGIWSSSGYGASGAAGEVVLNPANRQLAEDLASYLGLVLRRAAPSAEWFLFSTGAGLQPALRLAPGARQPAAVMKTAAEYSAAAFRPKLPEQERFFQRYQPLRADVDRWLAEADAPPATRRRWRFRRG
jgi:hypothetical protein